MNITISGSLGNIGRHLAAKLSEDGHRLTVITSNADRKQAIEELGATAAVGSISDETFLTSAIQGADAVFVLTPPNLGGQNIIANTIAAGRAFRNAIAAAGVRRVVVLSSIGAEFEGDTGPIASLHHIENFYKELKDVSVTFLRAGYFYTNYFNDVQLVKQAGIIGANYPANTKLPLVHPKDIALAAAAELLKKQEGKNVRYIVSQYLTAAEVAGILGEAIARPELSWVEFSDDQSIEGMKQAGVPAEVAGLYTEMGIAFRTGKLQADFEKTGAPQEGGTSFAAFAREFAAGF